MKTRNRIFLVTVLVIISIDFSSAQSIYANPKYADIYFESNLRKMDQDELMNYMDLALSKRKALFITSVSSTVVAGFSLVMATFTFHEFWNYPFYIGAGVVGVTLPLTRRWNYRYKLTRRVSQDKNYNGGLAIQPLLINSGTHISKTNYSPGISLAISF